MGTAFFFFIAIFSILYSLMYLWSSTTTKVSKGFISINNYILLFLIYGTVLIGFSAVYFILERGPQPILLEHTIPVDGSNYHIMGLCLYFSAITLLSVGYGDIVPVGVGRWVAMIEALIGYTMPAAFVLQVFREDR